MPPQPKRKISRRRKGKRRAAIRLKLATLVTCAHCGQKKQPHQLCPNCGQY
ncbi:MAG TPA: 50S ribosomal protein L32 [Patescibacteria group bacterium]|nr:50S ribosomal protein L32 [Patescibacteria group bacterium]